MIRGIIRFVNFNLIEVSIQPDNKLEKYTYREERNLRLNVGMLIEFEVKKSMATDIKILEQTKQAQPKSGKNGQKQNDILAQPVAAKQIYAEKTVDRSGYHFLNPYNFVRNLPEFLNFPEQDTNFFAKKTPPAQDIYRGLTGYLSCDINVITPLFISSGKPVNDQEHPKYNFFNIADKNGKRKVISGSSLRGMIRSIYETITNSCYAVFDDVTLSRRMEVTEGKNLTPARIIHKDGKWQLEMFSGRPSASLRPMKAAWISLYDPISGAPQRRRTKINLKKFKHGDPAWAVLETCLMKPNIHIWNVLELFDNKEEAELFKSKYQGNTIVESGWVCLTRQNTERKHDERFFFGNSQIVDLPEGIREDYTKIVRDYQKRHEEERDAERRTNTINEIAARNRIPKLSRFIIEEDDGLKDGDLVYVKFEGGKLVYIIPVQISRQMYEHSLGELLPKHLQPCIDYQELCPACRLFGWVKSNDNDNEDEDDENNNKKENVAYGSRVFFEQAELVNEVQGENNIVLAELASPKPTTTFFYLTEKNDSGKFIAKRDGFKPQEQELRGRKFYWHHNSFNWQRGEKTKRNRTIIDPVYPGSGFKFKIRFENLRPEELGALIWSVQMDNGMHHRLGFGKPLGLGSIDINIREGYTYNPKERYSSLKADGGRTLIELSHYVEVFKETFASAFKIKYEDSDTFKDLFAILKGQSNLPIHYPRPNILHSPKGNENFRWFLKPSAEKTLGIASKDKGLLI